MSNLDFILLLQEYLKKLEGGNKQFSGFIKRINTNEDKKYSFNILKMKKVSKNLLENTLKNTNDGDLKDLLGYALKNYKPDDKGLYNMSKIKQEFLEVEPYQKVLRESRKQEVKPEVKEEVKPLTDENYEEMITRHKKEGVYRPNLTSEEEDELRDLNKKYRNSKSEKNKVKLLERINILDNKKAESNKYKQNIFYPEIEKRGDEKRAERAKYQRKLLEIQENEEQKQKTKEEVKPEVENFDVISGKLQQLLFKTPIKDITKALVNLKFKGRLQTQKILLVQQLLQNFNSIEKMKQLINSLEEPDVKPEIKPEKKTPLQKQEEIRKERYLVAKNKKQEQKEISDAYQKVIEESQRQEKEKEDTKNKLIDANDKMFKLVDIILQTTNGYTITNKKAQWNKQLNDILTSVDGKPHDINFTDLINQARKSSDFIPTPTSILDKMKEYIKNSNKILEPTAGLGYILNYIRKNKNGGNKFNRTHAIEYNNEFVDILKIMNPDCEVEQNDFLQYNPKIVDNDLIIINPPYTKGNDSRYYMDFLFHCLYLMSKTRDIHEPQILIVCPDISKQDYTIRDGDTLDPANIFKMLSKPKIKEIWERYGQKITDKEIKGIAEGENEFWNSIEPVQIQFLGKVKFEVGAKITANLYHIICFSNKSTGSGYKRLTGAGFLDWISDKATDAYNYAKQKVEDVQKEFQTKGAAVLTRTNYVGPWNRLDDEYLRTNPPVDIIDEGAMKHDLEYSRIAKLRDDGKINKEETDKLIRDSDIAFLDNIRKHWKVNPWASALGYAGIRNKNLLEDYADLDKNLFVGQGKSYPLHAVIFKKPYDLETAKKEAKKFINDDKKKFYRETETSYRFRAIPKTKFEKKSFRTKKINSNISLIFGKLK